MLQNLAAGPFGKIHIDNHEIGTFKRTAVDRLNILDSLLTVGDDKNLAFYRMFLERLTDETGVCGAVLDQENERSSLKRDLLGVSLCRGA
jgi:hypothetical protein